MNQNAPSIQGMKAFCNRENIRRCKIIGTLGPSSSSKEMITNLVEAEWMSHGSTFPWISCNALTNIENVRAVAKETKRNVTILQDLQGPKIRCGKLFEESLPIEAKKRYKLVYGLAQEQPDTIPVDYANLAADVQKGERVMMDDGLYPFQF